MPRPAIKRRKPNSFSKSSPGRHRGPPDASAHREYLQRKLANVKVGSKPENSDDSDGIVTSRPGRNRRAIEIYASGGVAKGDKPGAFPTRSQRTRSLRGDTEEILSQRSRSTSRAPSTTSTPSARAPSVPQKEIAGAHDTASAKRRKITKPDANTNGASSITQAETSVLGVIKPRKRQNSILETLGVGYDTLGPDSSAIHSDEEERFLPDEVSTPAQVSTNGVRSDAARTTSSLKRKRGEAIASQQAPARSSSSLSSLNGQQQLPEDPQPEIPRPSRSQQRKLSTTQRASKAFNDIMAPPESSDSEDSSDEHEQLPMQSSKLRKQDPVVPSTRQLQDLMPTKQEKPVSAFQPQDEFDIRVDSTSSAEEEEQQEEHSTFSPVRTRRGQRNGTSQPKAKTKGKEKTRKPRAKGGKETGKIKAGTKSTRNTSYTPSPVRLRTPLPLSSSKPRGSEAKSPSKQDTIMRDKTANTPLATRSTRSTKKRYGGSRRKEAGKENQPILLSDVASGSDSSSVDKERLKAARRQANGPEIKAWKKKWADIDDFELEFEEVPVSTRSSSPTVVHDRLGKKKAAFTITTSASAEVTPYYRPQDSTVRLVNDDNMSYRPPPSPPLPTFAIKDLAGPSNPPGLISISKRRYDATLKSNPNAALLYLDDDDGELITVGSSLELSQRLEEPVPKYIRELRDPADGKLVHVFDINHTSASLFEWRDHEAYSSKHFHSLSSPFQSPRIGIDSPPKHLDSNVTYPSLPKSHDEDCTTSPDTGALPQSSNQNQKKENGVAFDFLDGIEEHLSGLANVLQIAANTLQKAADKTKETDTSVIEDILKGVKGILTEVGAFGVEAFKELGSEINTTIDDKTSTSACAPDEAAPVKEEEKIAAQLAREAKQEHDLRSARKDSQPPEAIVQTSKSPIVEDFPCEDLAPKVKFNLPEAPVRKELTQHDLDRLIPLHARSARSDQDSKLSLLDEPSASKLQNPSFLDDSSEDADFTARYPPLSTVRRARSTIERPLQWPADRREKAKAQCKYYRELAAADRENLQQPTQAGCPSAVSPFASPRPDVAYESIMTGQSILRAKKESTEVVQKPLPGAWPDIKNDSAPTLPISSESSGDFFNRMVGRARPSRYRSVGLDSGLHRASTTASSNPASRLNGPFDPGFPYDPSPASSYRPNSFRPYHPHRRSASPPSWGKMLPPARSRSDKRPSLNPETNTSPSPSSSANFRTPFDVGTRNPVDSTIHRAVKHYRSVPQFHIPPSPPYQIMNTKPATSNVPRPLQRSTTDFLTGPPMPMPVPMPPPMPFTTRPNFPPRPTPPNLWAPWQSSPPTQLPADEGTNISSLNGFSTHNESTSPVSSQSTTTGDLDIPNNEPPFPSAQPQSSSSSMYRYPTPPRPPPALPTFFPPPPVVEPMQIEPVKDKIDECVDQLKMCGFGVDDDNLKNRLHVYAVAADGDVTEAVEMIEQDRRMTAPGRFDGA